MAFLSRSPKRHPPRGETPPLDCAGSTSLHSSRRAGPSRLLSNRSKGPRVDVVEYLAAAEKRTRPPANLLMIPELGALAEELAPKTLYPPSASRKHRARESARHPYSSGDEEEDERKAMRGVGDAFFPSSPRASHRHARRDRGYAADGYDDPVGSGRHSSAVQEGRTRWKGSGGLDTSGRAPSRYRAHRYEDGKEEDVPPPLQPQRHSHSRHHRSPPETQVYREEDEEEEEEEEEDEVAYEAARRHREALWRPKREWCRQERGPAWSAEAAKRERDRKSPREGVQQRERRPLESGRRHPDGMGGWNAAMPRAGRAEERTPKSSAGHHRHAASAGCTRSSPLPKVSSPEFHPSIPRVTLSQLLAREGERSPPPPPASVFPMLISSTERVRYRNEVSKKVLDFVRQVSDMYDCQETMKKEVWNAMCVDPRYAKAKKLAVPAGKGVGSSVVVNIADRPQRGQRAALRAVLTSLELLQSSCVELVSTYLSPEEKRYLGLSTHFFQTFNERMTHYQYDGSETKKKRDTRTATHAKPKKTSGDGEGAAAPTTTTTTRPSSRTERSLPSSMKLSGSARPHPRKAPVPDKDDGEEDDDTLRDSRTASTTDKYRRAGKEARRRPSSHGEKKVSSPHAGVGRNGSQPVVPLERAKPPSPPSPHVDTARHREEKEAVPPAMPVARSHSFHEDATERLASMSHVSTPSTSSFAPPPLRSPSSSFPRGPLHEVDLPEERHSGMVSTPPTHAGSPVSPLHDALPPPPPGLPLPPSSFSKQMGDHSGRGPGSEPIGGDASAPDSPPLASGLPTPPERVSSPSPPSSRSVAGSAVSREGMKRIVGVPPGMGGMRKMSTRPGDRTNMAPPMGMGSAKRTPPPSTRVQTGVTFDSDADSTSPVDSPAGSRRELPSTFSDPKLPMGSPVMPAFSPPLEGSGTAPGRWPSPIPFTNGAPPPPPPGSLTRVGKKMPGSASSVLPRVPSVAAMKTIAPSSTESTASIMNKFKEFMVSDSDD